MAQVTRSQLAQQDLEGILEYLDSQSREAADNFAANLRHFTVWNYAIFDRPARSGIAIIRILHGARDIPKLFE